MSTPAASFVRPPWSSPAAVWSVLVAGPAEEPLTVADAKLRAGLDWLAGDPRDLMLEDFIRAARAHVEHDTGLALITQTRDVYVDAPAGCIVPLPSQTQPTQSLEALTVEPTRALVAPFGPYVAGVTYGITAAPVAYRVVAGWPSAAVLRLEAPALYHAVALLVAHMATAGRDAVSVGAAPAIMPFGYEDAVAPHRLVWVT
jgi:hypothetical protein